MSENKRQNFNDLQGAATTLLPRDAWPWLGAGLPALTRSRPDLPRIPPAGASGKCLTGAPRCPLAVIAKRLDRIAYAAGRSSP